MLTDRLSTAASDYFERLNAGELGKTSPTIFCRGGRTGSKLHLSSPGSSVLNCGHWLKASASHFQLPVATALVWIDNSKGSVLCEKCFAAILSPDAPADAEVAKPRRAGRKPAAAKDPDHIANRVGLDLTALTDDDFAQLAAAIRTEGKRRRAAARRAR
jgi:hypothetical protein